MAYIEVAQNYGWEIDVRVTDLDWSYAYSGRLATFSISGDSTNYVTEIKAEAYSSPTVTISGLEPGVTYTIKCTISGIVGSNDVKLSSVSVTTNPGVLYAFYKQGNYTPLWTDKQYLFGESELNLLSGCELQKRPSVSEDYFRLGARIVASDGSVLNESPRNTEHFLDYGETYVIGCSVYYNGLYYDFPTIEVCEYLRPEIISVSRQQDNPWMADVDLICHGEYALGYEYCLVSGYKDGEYYYIHRYAYEELKYLQGSVRLSIPLYHIGENKIWLAYYRSGGISGNAEFDVHYIDPLPLSFSVSNKYTDLTGYLDYNAGQFFSTWSGYEEYLNRNSVGIYVGFENGYDAFDAYAISEDGLFALPYGDSEQSGINDVAWIEIWDGWVMTHRYEKSIYYPPKMTVSLTASRDETHPENIYASVWFDNAYSYISKIVIIDSDIVTVGTRANPASSPVDFTLYDMGTKSTRIRAHVYRDSEFVTSGWCTVEGYSPQITLWTWDESNGSASQSETVGAYNAIDLKLSASSFSYKVWNDLVEKVREAYRLKNDGENTVYEQYLDNALMNSSDALYGKKLLAVKFNNVRSVIGGALSTFKADDNAIHDHFSDTGSWDMQPGEKVLGSYIKALAAKLNEGIGDLL